MTYRTFATVPQHERLQYDERKRPIKRPDTLEWGSDIPPPAPGTDILIIVNGRFPAKVTGYFEEEGYLGLLCQHTEDAHVFGRTIPAGTDTHVFGSEFRLP